MRCAGLQGRWGFADDPRHRVRAADVRTGSGSSNQRAVRGGPDRRDRAWTDASQLGEPPVTATPSEGEPPPQSPSKQREGRWGPDLRDPRYRDDRNWRRCTKPACCWMSDSRTCGMPGFAPRRGALGPPAAPAGGQVPCFQLGSASPRRPCYSEKLLLSASRGGFELCGLVIPNRRVSRRFTVPRRGVDSPPGPELLGAITSHGPSRESYTTSRKASGLRTETAVSPAADPPLPVEGMRTAVWPPTCAAAVLQR